MPGLKPSTLRKVVNAVVLAVGALLCLALGLSANGVRF